MEIVAYPLVPPNSLDPDSMVLLDGGRMDGAARQLTDLIGMLEETGYSDALSDDWGGAVTLGVRFLYYHELGHLVRNLVDGKEHPDWLDPGEEYLVEELLADQHALAMLTMELRRHPELQPVGFSGVALALGFVALKEFAEKEYGGGKRRTKNATIRMHRLLYWGALNVRLGEMTEEAITQGQFFWDLIVKLLRRVEGIPSPVFTLMFQTGESPEEDWRTASNHILRWCVFGDRVKLLSIIRKIRDSALEQATEKAGARKVLDVINFLLKDTDHLEPTLGLRAALKQ